MLPSINFVFLTSLGLASWIILCCLNQPSMRSAKYEYLHKYENGWDYGSKKTFQGFLSYMLTVDTLLKLSMLFPLLLVVFVFVNIILNKIKEFAYLATKEKITLKTNFEIEKLKNQNSQLNNLVNKFKYENQNLIDRVKSDYDHIQMLKKSSMFCNKLCQNGGKPSGYNQDYSFVSSEFRKNNYGNAEKDLNWKHYTGKSLQRIRMKHSIDKNAGINIVTTQELELIKGMHKSILEYF